MGQGAERPNAWFQSRLDRTVAAVDLGVAVEEDTDESATTLPGKIDL
jgi:hypothetical protein